MFKSKRKTELPALPEVPSWDQMEEDLKASATSDIVFISSPFAGGITDGMPTEKSTDEFNKDDLFEKARDFVMKNDNILQNMQVLEEKQEQMRNATQNLKKTVESVRQQALVAISDCENRS
ncbi:hypothetical protein SK128_004156 [Halocaridina rubra]|uniref:Uncharacterized protein n=1 Tax=Halocaridina rubra TaxID=373956 RepID=A0AAN8XB09_HALRR